LEKQEYKYKIPDNGDIIKGVIYLEVIKSPHWVHAPNQIINCIPIGAITWTTKSYIKEIDGITKFDLSNNQGVILEKNRYMANFDPSCFEILHTSIQKIKK